MTDIEAWEKDAKKELAMLETCILVCGACDPETCMFYNVVKYAERRMQRAMEMIKKDIELVETLREKIEGMPDARPGRNRENPASHS